MQTKVNITYGIYSLVTTFLIDNYQLISVRIWVKLVKRWAGFGFWCHCGYLSDAICFISSKVGYHCLMPQVRGWGHQTLSSEFLFHHSFHSFLHSLHHMAAFSSCFGTSPSSRLLLFVAPCPCREVERVLLVPGSQRWGFHLFSMAAKPWLESVVSLRQEFTLLYK